MAPLLKAFWKAFFSELDAQLLLNLVVIKTTQKKLLTSKINFYVDKGGGPLIVSEVDKKILGSLCQHSAVCRVKYCENDLCEIVFL